MKRLKADSSFSVKTLCQYVFIAIASFVFASTQFQVFANIHGTRLALTCDEEIHLIDLHTKTSYSRHHFPTDSHPALPDSETPGENEVEEEQVDEGNDICESLSASKTVSESLLLHRQLQFKRSLQNRPSVSLVILHHSWKSFLV